MIPIPFPRNTYQLPQQLGKKLSKKHSIILGKTGSGKSQRLKAIAYHLHRQPNTTVIVLDPHGALAEECLGFCTHQKGLDKIVYIDPSYDHTLTPCINPLWKPVTSIHQAQVLAQERTHAFLQLLHNSTLSLQMQVLLEPTLTALLLTGKHDISTLQQWMNADKDNPYFKNIICKLPSVVKHFFDNGFYDKRYTISKNSIYTKLQALLNHQVLYEMLTGKQSFDLDAELGT